jgi:hypothetical protein
METVPNNLEDYMKFKVELQQEDRIIKATVYAKDLMQLDKQLAERYPKWKPVCIIGG